MKVLKALVVFLGIFLGGQYLIAFFLDALIMSGNFRYCKLYSDAEMNPEILCFGNSRAIHSFYTPYVHSEYGLDAFNLSYNALKLGVINIFIQDYLDKHVAPKKVYIEISDVTSPLYTSEYSKFSIYMSHSERLSKAIKEEDATRYYMNKILPLYKYNTEFLYRNLFYLKKSDQTWVNRYTISKELNEETLTAEPITFEINDFKLNQLKDIVGLLEARNIEVVLYIAPYLPNYRKKIKGLRKGVKTIELETGLEIIDLSDALDNVAFFSDRIHPNETGTRQIIDLLLR